ncbi:MAG: effector binding domain-containing protein [Oscillospiraceae bacterium]|nr:effector binding domain-containing protein [Oscillospiraceae bacterium]
MKQMQTVGAVSKNLGISSRMLRYYEKIGLIESGRMEDYAYRVYDEAAIRKIRQIIILRKLRVPVKQIREIFGNDDAVGIIEIFERNISELDEQITALSTVKSILYRLVQELHEKANMRLQLDYLGDNCVFAIVESISFPSNTLPDEKSIDDLNKASEDLMKPEDKDVRIVYLPPMTVAAAYADIENAEENTMDAINKFVAQSGLLKIKPDARGFGFDCSPEFQGIGAPSKMYESWVSIPDDMEVPPPLVKRKFSGGLYAAHVLREWDFQDWRRLGEWVNASEKYANDWGSPRWESKETKAGEGFEEILNFYNYTQNSKMENLQLDLLFPIKEKEVL